MSERTISHIIPGRDTSDGAGVRLRRTVGQSQQTRLDPFLMLDEFSSFDANDYIAGFPSHPHRGFETVTYMLDGHMLHEDHMGNRGDLRPGDVQWMTAGRGIIHSEMPQQREGRMRGFQLWINLPAREKMKAAGYRDIPAADMAWHNPLPGVRLKVIAGSIALAEQRFSGPIQGLSTEAIYTDLELSPETRVSVPLPAAHNAFMYVFEGSLRCAGKDIPTHAAAVLNHGTSVTVSAGTQGARLLLLAGKPLGEPVAQYGPFVMNTMQELEQAVKDFRNGTLTTG